MKSSPRANIKQRRRHAAAGINGGFFLIYWTSGRTFIMTGPAVGSGPVRLESLCAGSISNPRAGCVRFAGSEKYIRRLCIAARQPDGPSFALPRI